MSANADDDYMPDYDTYDLVYECIASHNEEVLIQLIEELNKNYSDLARLATFGEYKKSWSHKDVINYVTYNT